jgi:hypothetical protein
MMVKVVVVVVFTVKCYLTFNDSGNEEAPRELLPLDFIYRILKLLCALLSRKERRSGWKVGEERVPPRDGGEGAGVQFQGGCLENEHVRRLPV